MSESSPSHDAQKTYGGTYGTMHRSFYDRSRRQVRDLSSGPLRILLAIEVRPIQCRQFRTVNRERLSFLADNLFYT